MRVPNADIRCHELLNEIYNDKKVGVEIGVFRGDLSWRLLASNRNIFLYLVDPWTEASEEDSYLRDTTDYVARFSQAEHDETMRMALNAVKPFTGQYEILRMTSEKAAPRFNDESLDFVFIDGDHSYIGCSLDIRLWYPKVKNGGVFSGHDYREKDGYGVIRAVDEFVSSANTRLKLGGNYTWFVRK